MNQRLWLAVVVLLLPIACLAGRRTNSRYNTRSRSRGRERSQVQQTASTRNFPFTSSEVDNWFNSFLSNGVISTSDETSSTFQWTYNGNTFSFSSSSESDTSEENEQKRPTTTSPLINRPWRSVGSFTGDLKLDCWNKRCTKGAVLIYNREQKRWGTICGDRWTRRESEVVCNYLQFSRGSRRALRVKAPKLSAENRMLPISYKQMRCSGDEDVLIECNGAAVTPDQQCNSNLFAAVVCIGSQTDSSETPDCAHNEVICANRQKCIDRSYVCDGMSDCPWGTDEENCEESTAESCPSSQFSCGINFGGCISSMYRCDGDRDCSNGKDENNCEDHLAHFEKTDNSKLNLESYRYNSGWRNASPYLCAKKCREESSFRCLSFDYNKLLRECDLTTEGKRNVGILSKRHSRYYDHYEITAPTSCSGFACADLCLANSQVCDGRPDCSNRIDEANCTSEDVDDRLPWELRLDDGITNMDGRLEVRRGSGEYGLICDVGWTRREASVACRQLGFRNGAVDVVPGLSFHRTRKRIVLSGIRCTGREQRLSECRHDSWGQVNCPRDHEVGVICEANGRPSPSPTISNDRRPSTTVAETTAVPSAPRPERPSTCGVKPRESSLARPRIVGGNNAAPHEWPWQAAIWINNRLLCGGTLIDGCWVLTAAHCFTRKFPLRIYTIRIGDHRSKAHDGTEQDFEIKRLVSHNYNTNTHDNDIALIELKRKNGRCATLNENVDIACLPTGTNQFPADHKCKIVGWGQTQWESEIPFTNILKQATVPLISDSVCRTQTVYRNALTVNMMCAGYLKGGVDTCQGDSGGPLLCKASNNRYYIWGVVSWGNGCAEPKSPGIYTKVANYLSWIRRTTQI